MTKAADLLRTLMRDVADLKAKVGTDPPGPDSLRGRRIGGTSITDRLQAIETRLERLEESARQGITPQGLRSRQNSLEQRIRDLEQAIRVIGGMPT